MNRIRWLWREHKVALLIVHVVYTVGFVMGVLATKVLGS